MELLYNLRLEIKNQYGANSVRSIENAWLSKTQGFSPFHACNEELSSAFGTALGQRGKPLSERRLRAKALKEGEPISDTGINCDEKNLSRIFRLLGDATSSSQEEPTLNEKAAICISLAEPANDMRSWLERTEPDPSRRYIVLVQAAMETRRHPQSIPERAVRHGVINDALGDLLQQHTSKIKAGLNTAESIAAFPGSNADRQKMRQTYYEIAVENKSLIALFDCLESRFGKDKLQPCLNTFSKSLTDDIASHNPSVNINRLRHLLKDLSLVRTLESVIADCQALLARTPSTLPAKTYPPIQLARIIVGISDGKTFIREIEALMTQLVGANIKLRLAFLNRFLSLMKDLPENFWSTEKARETCVLNLLKRLDFIELKLRESENPIRFNLLESHGPHH